MSTQANRNHVPRDGGEHIPLMGMDLTIKVSKEMSGGSYILLESVLPADTGVVMHTTRSDEVTLHAEEPVVEKRTVPKERVRMDRDTVTDKETVSEEVR